METKKCTRCNSNKPLSDFYKSKQSKSGYLAACKDCIKKDMRKRDKEYYKKNKSKIDKKHREWHKKNKDSVSLRKKRYKEENPEKHKSITKKSREKNKEKIKEYRKKYNQRSEVKLRATLRSRIREALKNESKKAHGTEDLLGCSVDFLKIYLSKMFKEGMSWENHGEWHIDHIKPCSSFDLTKESEQRKCFHYTNLQPLWAEENLKKNNKF